jgi:outer membrane protein TolC
VDAYNRGFLQRSHAAQLNLRASRLRVVSALKAEKASSANLKIVESREALGMANYLELLDAQLAFKTAQSNLISAISDFNSSLSEWEYVTASAEQTAE